jgi:hypothetical protein
MKTACQGQALFLICQKHDRRRKLVATILSKLTESKEMVSFNLERQFVRKKSQPSGWLKMMGQTGNGEIKK